jgi:hypothetical protein
MISASGIGCELKPAAHVFEAAVWSTTSGKALHKIAVDPLLIVGKSSHIQAAPGEVMRQVWECERLDVGTRSIFQPHREGATL